MSGKGNDRNPSSADGSTPAPAGGGHDSSQALTGLRLWITRPLPAATKSARRWRESGAEVDIVPLIELSPLDADASAWSALVGALEGEARIVLTSGNSASQLLRACGERDEALLASLLRIPASAVGLATARAAEELGFVVDHVAGGATGADLALSLVDRGESGPVILPGSDRRRPDVEEILMEAGIPVVPLTVYRTAPARELDEAAAERLRRGEVDAAVVYSPSAVLALVACASRAGVDPASLPACLALGPTTAAEVQERGLRLAALPSKPGEEALVRAAAAWWNARRPRP